MVDARALTGNLDAKARGGMLRYLIVVIGGFIVDLSIAWTTHEIIGLDLLAATALGFLVAMCLSYFAHEFWTFRSTQSTYSTARMTKFAAASGATLATRLLLVWLSAPLAVLPAGSLSRLLLAFGGSLVVGYLVNRLLVFGQRAEE
jgi:putative flippase GtrA